MSLFLDLWTYWIVKPASMVDSFGKVLVPEVTGLKDNQLGPVALVADATLLVPEVVALSFCSQQ